MKQVGPGFNALRQAVTATNGADDRRAGRRARTSCSARPRRSGRCKHAPDAIQWTEDAKRESDALAAAAAKGDWEAVKAARAQAAGRLRSAATAIYRERLDDGTYRFKPPAQIDSTQVGLRRSGRQSAVAHAILEPVLQVRLASSSCLQQLHQVLLPDRRQRVRAVAGGAVAERDHDRAPLRHALDLFLEQRRSPAD